MAPLGLLSAVAINPASPSVQEHQGGSRMPTSESGGRIRLLGRVLLSSDQVLTDSSICRTQFGSEEEYGTFFFFFTLNCCEKVSSKYQILPLGVVVKLFAWDWILDLSCRMWCVIARQSSKSFAHALSLNSRLP